ncbi:alpha/beta hydrolase family esterase [Sphingomonas sp. Leaf343]|uniref:alpha/beta hydrolase family esterase n=1 Tax=Sphingomonas sp. Leaf343 TaxID=1736345 RepID=UPI0009EB2377|nr:PHB depolymerase family esterase [Sphingomonas sp. Leaf343]
MSIGSHRRLALWALACLSGVIATGAAACPLASGGAARFSPGAGAAPVGVHVPAGWTGAQAAPLVILLHGSTGTGAQMLASSGLAATADLHGFLLAYPDGGIRAKTGFVWNIPGVPTVEGRLPGPGDRDDVAYIGGLIDGMVAAGCVDRARVYVTGLSGGGRMVSWLGCVAPERFAAIAPVVGLRAGHPLASDPARPDPATCRPATPVSVIAFAGDRDQTNPIGGGGAGYWRYTMHAAEQRWAQLNGCPVPPMTRWVAAAVYEERYAGCSDGTEVVAWISVGRGHEWVVDNDTLWAFLSRHRRPGR